MDSRSRTTALRHSPWLALPVLTIFILVLTTCGSDDPVEVPPGNNGIIGPAGGTVTDAGGAGVTIPADALTEDVAITVKTFVDPETGPYPTGPVPIFWGGAQFGPAGTLFSKPVSITLPTRAPLNPGDDYQLFAYDPDNQRWVIEKGAAIVATGGQALEAEVSHFSVFNGGGNTGGGQARGDITDMLCAFGSAEAVCHAYVAYFRKYIADVGDRGGYDGECKEVCGLDMYITCEINGDNFFLSYREGERVGEEVMIHDPDDCAGGDGDIAMLEATSTIYYHCAPPGLSVIANPREIQLGGSSTVMASLTCGQMVLAGQSVEFECVGVGQIDRNSATTNPAGQAQVMYTNDELEGEATVTAYFDACAGQINEETVTDKVVITTTDNDSWSGTMLVMFTQTIGGAPLFNFTDFVSIDFNLSISEQNIISGTGTGTHVVSVTAGEDCWVSSVSAPGFPVVVTGTATAQTMNFVVFPSSMMALSFVITCPVGDDDDTTDYPYPMAEGLLEGSILYQDIKIAVAREDGAEDSNSGSRDEGTDIPMDYSYEVRVSR